jgi:hypothetical protein
VMSTPAALVATDLPSVSASTDSTTARVQAHRARQQRLAAAKD